jgi:hypothetical protein
VSVARNVLGSLLDSIVLLDESRESIVSLDNIDEEVLVDEECLAAGLASLLVETVVAS